MTAAGDVDMSRFLAASEPQPGDNLRERKARRRRNGDDSPAPTEASRAGGSTATATTDEKHETDDRKERRRPGAGAAALLRRSRGLVRLVVIVAIVVVAALLLRAYVVAPYYIPSASMEPTLHGCPGCNDDHILVDKVSYRLHDPHASDIVVFDKPANAAVPENVLVKRVVAVGGDDVALRGGYVYVNNAKLDEPYINDKCGKAPSRPLGSTTSWKVPDDDVFVLGDNRCDSLDSRAFGPIKNSSIVGRAWFIIWPLKRFGSIGD